MNCNAIAPICLTLAGLSFFTLPVASCPSAPIFSCTTANGKTVEVCDSIKTVDYSFGRLGLEPEMSLSVPRDTVTTRQWDGLSRNMYYSVLIPNGKTIYEVFSSIDKFDEETTHGIHVLANNKTVATIVCRPDTVTSNIEDARLEGAPDE